MMKIIGVRLKPLGDPTLFQRIVGRIKNMVENYEGDNFDFLMDINGKKSIVTYGPDHIDERLVNQSIQVLNSTTYMQFQPMGDVTVTGPKKESLIPKHNLDQLKAVRSVSKSSDIGDRVADMNKGANLHYMRSGVDNIETFEDFEKKNKKFIPGWNLKHLNSPFSGDEK